MLAEYTPPSATSLATSQCFDPNPGPEEGFAPIGHLLHCPLWMQATLVPLLAASLFAFSKSLGVFISHWRLDAKKRTWEFSFLSEDHYLLDHL